MNVFSTMTFTRAHIGVLEFIILHFSVQDEDVRVYSEHTNTKCHTSTLMAIVICMCMKVLALYYTNLNGVKNIYISKFIAYMYTLPIFRKT